MELQLRHSPVPDIQRIAQRPSMCWAMRLMGTCRMPSFPAPHDLCLLSADWEYAHAAFGGSATRQQKPRHTFHPCCSLHSELGCLHSGLQHSGFCRRLSAAPPANGWALPAAAPLRTAGSR